MRRFILICFSSLLLIAILPCRAAEDVSALSQLSTEKLVELGQHADSDNNPEKALVYFTIAAKRYNPENSRDEKFQSMNAYIGKWYVYFFVYFDHVNAFEALSKAQEIADEIGHSSSRILLNYGCMYQTLAEQSEDRELLRKAWDFYLRSFETSGDSDANTANMAFSNLVQLATELNKVSELQPMLKSFLKKNASVKQKTPSFIFDSISYGIITRFDSKDYAGAIAELNSETLNRVVLEPGMRRYDIVRRINLAKAYILMSGKYDHALRIMLRAEEIADSMDMKDARLEVYKYLRDLYMQSGENSKSLDYQHKYLALKDTVLNYRSGAAISELTYLKKVNEVEHNLDELENKRMIQKRIIWGAVVFIVLVTMLLILLRRHNKRLRVLNETLYHKNILLMENEDSMRRQLEETARLREKESNPPARNATEKYSHSDLSDNEKEDIYLGIMNVLLNTPEVFSPDFSANRLAELTGYSYRHISQVINEKTGDNFNALINDIRIREACRGVRPGGKFARFTVEGIANAVGFRSRTSFIAAFKKFTGMTPSVYMKTAEQRAKTQTN